MKARRNKGMVVSSIRLDTMKSRRRSRDSPAPLEAPIAALPLLRCLGGKPCAIRTQSRATPARTGPNELSGADSKAPRAASRATWCRPNAATALPSLSCLAASAAMRATFRHGGFSFERTAAAMPPPAIDASSCNGRPAVLLAGSSSRRPRRLSPSSAAIALCRPESHSFTSSGTFAAYPDRFSMRTHCTSR